MTSPSFTDDVILLIPFNVVTQLTDTKKHSINVNGSPAINSQVGRFSNGSCQLHGLSNEYFQVAASDDLDLHTENFTIEVSFYPTVANTACLYSSDTSYDNVGAALYVLESNNPSNLILKFFLQDNGANISLLGQTTITLNAWHEAAVSRVDGSLYLFLDGNLETSYNPTSQGKAAIGSVDFSRGSYIGKDFAGYLNDFRLSQNFGYTVSYQTNTQPFPYQIEAWDFIRLANEITARMSLTMDYIPASEEVTSRSTFSLDMERNAAPEACSTSVYGIDFGSQLNKQQVSLIGQKLTIANLEHLVAEGVQIIPYSAGSYCLFSFDLAKVGTLVENHAWIDENSCLWLKPDGVTIGNAHSTADIPLDTLQRLFYRLYHNDNCQLYDMQGNAIAKIDPFVAWNNNSKLAVFSDLIASPGVETLICTGVLLNSTELLTILSGSSQ